MNMMNYRLPLAVCLCLCLFGALNRVQAHSILVKSTPAENTRLDSTPAEIRLWFSEPLEPRYSRFDLHDSSGNILATATSTVDSADAHQMFMPLNPLADGLYSISYMASSAADGHHTTGSFPFSVGVPIAAASVNVSAPEALPVDGALVRAFNLIALSLLVGGAAFVVFIWRPLALPVSETRLLHLIGIGWLATGAAGVAMLVLQTGLNTNTALGDGLTPAFVLQTLNTVYGLLWIMRMGCWLIIGVLLVRSARHRRNMALVLILSAVMLLAQTLFSHAGNAPERAAALVGGWLHLLATACWVGGLVALAVMIPVLRKQPDGMGTLARAVALFSNYVRVAVAALIVTGVYAAWLHVGSLDALTGTLYGQALLIKIVLIMPLLLIAAVNLIFTQRGLERGTTIWGGRLRALVGAEIALTCGVLLAVGALTSLDTARVALILQQRAAAALPNEVGGMVIKEGTHVMLTAKPGYVGQNTFVVMLLTLDNKPINDVDRVRLRFDKADGSGTSELDIRGVQPKDGIYRVEGANLSSPGVWRVRLTVQRPGQYDVVTDFQPTVSAAPVAQALDPTPPIQERSIANALAGMAALAVGGALLAQRRSGIGARVLALLLTAGGIVFLLSGLGAGYR